MSWPTTHHRRRRRVSRAHEASALLVAAVILPGRVKAPGQRAWLRAVREAIDAEPWCESKRGAVWLWAVEVASHVRTGAMTTVYTNSQVLAATGKRSATTMKSYRQWAESRGLLAQVAPGRRGVYAPAATNCVVGADGTRTWSNDAAVRVLTMSKETARRMTEPESCGQKLPPSPGSGLEDSPRAHARRSSNCSEPLRGTESERLAALRPGQSLPAHRYRAWWARRPTKSSNEEAVARARLLGEYAPILRGTTDHWVAHVIKPFVKAGWSVADLVRAIDTRPDGTSWAVEARVRRPEWWLSYRLAWWTDEHGRPLASLSQRARTLHERDLAALAAARAEREAAPPLPRVRRLAAQITNQRTVLRVAPDRQRPGILARIDQLEAEMAAAVAAAEELSGGAGRGGGGRQAEEELPGIGR